MMPDFDSAAAWYDANAAEFIRGADAADTAPDRRRFLDLLRERSRPRVLDVGCGSGRDLAAFEAAGCHVTGIDPSAAMIAECRRRLSPAARLHQSGLLDFDGPAGAWDGVWAMGSLHHLPLDLQVAAWMRIARMLAPGGTALAWVKSPWPGHACEVLDRRGRVMSLSRVSDGRRFAQPAADRFGATVQARMISRRDSAGQETYWTEILFVRDQIGDWSMPAR